MTQLMFPDNTVLINFALIRRIDLLGRVLNSRGSWCTSVAEECRRSAQLPGRDPLRDVPDLLGEPLRPETQVEHLDTRTFREGMAKPGEGPLQHLGEAETIAIVSRRGLNAIFATDDTGAALLATAHQVPVVTTWGLLKLAHKVGFVDSDTLWGYVQTLRSEGRGAPKGVTDRPSFEKWLATPGR